MSEIKSISPLISQIILRQLGEALSTYNGGDTYHIVNATYTLQSAFEEEFIKTEWEKKGKDYARTQRLLKKLQGRSMIVKGYYDSIDDKRFDQRSKEINLKKGYFKAVSKMPLIMPELYNYLVFLINLNVIQRLQIPPDAFKILEHRNMRGLLIGTRKDMLSSTSMPMMPTEQQVGYPTGEYR